MDRYGGHGRSGSVVARYVLASVLVAILILFFVYPTTTLYSIHPFPSSSVFVQHPDITLGTYDTKPTIDGLAPSVTVQKPATLLEHLPPQPILIERDVASCNECSTLKSGGAMVYCKVSHCIAFFDLFEFWYPGCEDMIDSFTPFPVDDFEDLGSLLEGEQTSHLESVLETEQVSFGVVQTG